MVTKGSISEIRGGGCRMLVLSKGSISEIRGCGCRMLVLSLSQVSLNKYFLCGALVVAAGGGTGLPGCRKVRWQSGKRHTLQIRNLQLHICD